MEEFEESPTESKPRIAIEFCTKCRWNFRATWYLQELLSTFGEDLGEVALIPRSGGIFTVTVQQDDDAPVLVWDRKIEKGFPDSKELKRLVRDVIDPGRDLGHVDSHGKPKTAAVKSEASAQASSAQSSNADGADDDDECVDCEPA